MCCPCCCCFVLYWPGLTTWFYQDDFGWLNLRHDVHSARDLAGALFAPKAHGNMRPLGENAFWLGLGAVFGVEPLPFHICTFLTQSASLLLLGSIVQRLVGWAPAGLCAQILWLVNRGLAPAMGWSSIYNQVLSAFFFLLAFYFLLRHIETGRRAYELAHWTAFVLGLGALEINVVYPALAALYVFFGARPYLKKILPMFAVSAAAVMAHFYFAPPPHAGVYAPRVDSAIGATLWTYWRWVLGPMPAVAAALVAACVIALIVWGLGAASPPHYLAPRGLCFPCCRICPCPITRWTTTWRCPRSASRCWARMRLRRLGKFAAGRKNRDRTRHSGVYGDFPAGVVDRHPLAARTRRAGGRSGARRGRDSSGGEGKDHSAGRDRYRALLERRSGSAVPRQIDSGGVPCTGQRGAHSGGARSALEVRAAAGDRTARAGGERAVVYRFDGQMLHNETAHAGARWTEDEPRFVNIGDPVFCDYVGTGWRDAANGYRRMERVGTLRIAAPRSSGESLYIGVFETRDFLPRVRVHGAAVPVALARRDNDLSEFRATLPPEAAQWKQMEVAIESPLPGAAAVRLRGGAVSRRDFPALTGLRFFLALWVILHHLTGPGQKLEATALLLPHGLFTLIRGGYQAVTTFFVLSGFVLTRSYSATLWNRRNTLRYALGRAARVYPGLPAEPGGGGAVHSGRPDTG